MTEKPNSTELAQITYQGVIIHDRQEKLSLTDMWRASGADESRRPVIWLGSAEAKRFIEFLAETLNVKNFDFEIIQTVRGGNAAGTWAHWQVALAYAKYLSPEFHVWCNTVVRERMQGKPSQQHVAVASLDADVRRIMGGVTKAVMSKALEDRLAPMEAAIMKLSDRFSTLAIEHDPRVAALDYISARELLDEAKVPSKGRNRLNRRVGNALRALVLQSPDMFARRCPRTGTWLFPTDMAHKFMRQSGRDLVAQHMDRLAEKMGQSVLRFPRGKKKSEPSFAAGLNDVLEDRLQ